MSIHHHHHAEPSNHLDRAFGFGITLNLLFVAIEASYGWKINSLALLADAGHNLSDVAGLVLAWVATMVGRRRANARNTYGWQRASVLAAFANALLLLIAMGALAWEALRRLPAAAATDGQTIMWVAGIGIVVNAATALLFMRNQAHDLNVRGAFLHMAADAAVSAGVVIAGWLYLLYGWGWLDPVVSLLIAVVIVVGTWGLFRQSLHLLFDGVPDHIDPQAVHDWLSKQAGVSEVHDLHIWALSTTETALTAHLVMPGGHPGDVFLEEMTQELLHHFRISHPTLQIETSPMSHVCVQALGSPS